MVVWYLLVIVCGQDGVDLFQVFYLPPSTSYLTPPLHSIYQLPPASSLNLPPSLPSPQPPPHSCPLGSPSSSMFSSSVGH